MGAFSSNALEQLKKKPPAGTAAPTLAPGAGQPLTGAPLVPTSTTAGASDANAAAIKAQQKQKTKAASGSLIGKPVIGRTRAIGASQPRTLIGGGY